MGLYEHKQEFLIKCNDVDFKDRLKVSVALSFMQEVASASAHELGFGYAQISPLGLTFMVLNIHLEFTRPILLGENVRVKTWPLPPSHVYFGREFQMEGEDGTLLFNATSRWCLMDLTVGKVAQSKRIENQDYSTYNTTKLFDSINWKLPVFQQDEGELRFTITIANSEYDHNMHVNNTRYAEYCLNCFSVAELSNMKLKSFSISYLKQCKEGDTLRFYRKKIAENEYLAHGFNDAGEMVVQSRICFEEAE